MDRPFKVTTPQGSQLLTFPHNTATRTVALALHLLRIVTTETPAAERRLPERGDRRRNSRSGRRKADPRTSWRRVAWLFALYAAYLSVRSFPRAVRQLWNRRKV